MADVFGNLDLFSEFEKDRVAQDSFIHYDEAKEQSKIVFEDYNSDGEESNEEDVDTFEERQSNKAISGVENPNNESKESNAGEHSGKTGPDPSSNSNGAVDPSGNIIADTDDICIKRKDKETSISWLNEQLHAAAREEADGSDTTPSQLIYERNKFRRYAKILDSTRYVPDEESPALQLIFNNNTFSRKYRQIIEQFIKGLLWQEANEQKPEKIDLIDAKAGVPSCVEINSGLKVDKRTESMRQNHAIIGSCQFHKQFSVDFFGWPFTVSEPTRCNANWEIPIYSQVFQEVYADPSSKLKAEAKKKSFKPSCWNCGLENHNIAECKLPRNQVRIQANKREFEELRASMPKNNKTEVFSAASRYHLDPQIASKFVKYRPGVVSNELREALGLRENQLPKHIYKMRLHGYPPGWLEEAKRQTSGVTIFDKQGRVALITGECLEDGELDDVPKKAQTDIDISKIVEYPGFTVPVPEGMEDEHEDLQLPPIQEHQLKQTLMKQSTSTKMPKKRKRESVDSDEEESNKKSKKEDKSKESSDIATEDSTDQGVDVKTEMMEESEPVQEVISESLQRSISTTISLSKDYGTPIFERNKHGLPDSSKFASGIEDHIPFENLPDATGTFDKMKDLIDLIRQSRRK